MAAFDRNPDHQFASQSQIADCCPPTDQLIEFVAGQLDERKMAWLESHFEECPSCAELLVAMGDPMNDDSFEQRLREAANRELPASCLPHDTSARGEASSCRASFRIPGEGLPEPAVAQEIRQEFAGCERYELQEFLGGGGMGLVFAANHRVMDRRVAVKAIDPVLIGRQDVAARFEREVRALAALRHPNLVLAYDADAVGVIHFFVMELLEGEDLKRHVDRRGPLPFGAACRMMCTAAHALGAAHEEGIIHRDVKPRNLFLTKKGQLKVLDFGLASLRILEPERSVWATQSGVLLGTLDTMAPEQLDEPASVDARADVFGLGCTLYFIITGKSPFERPSRRETLQALLNGDVASPARLERGIPDLLGKYVLRMLAPDAADRPSTMDEVAEGLGAWLDAQDNSVARGDLSRAAAEGGVARRSEHVRPPDIRSRYLEGKPITARRAGPVARELKSAQRNPALVATALVLLLAVGGLCGAAFTWSGSGISPLVADLGIIAMSISANDHVTTWHANGTMTKGTSWQLDAKWEPRPYSMPPGKEVGDILAIDIMKDTNWVYTWYKDGTVSCGISTELDMYWPPRPFAVRKGVKHVVGIGMVDDQQVYVYYDDGTLSCGSVTDLTARFGNDSRPYQHYSLPQGKSPRDILGIGISKEVKVYAWYRDGTASAGSFKKLDNLRPPYPFTAIRQADEP